MNNYYYSAKYNGFYLSSFKAEYEESKEGWPDDTVSVTYDDYNALLDGQAEGKLIAADSNGRPVLTDPVIDWQASAESQRQSQLSEADSTIADWRTELQLDIISDDDKASMIKWMTYIKALKALDFTSIADETGYKAISWPDRPQ